MLACVAGALLARLPIVGYVREDLAFQAWTAGCVLAFAPALLASADASVALVPVCFVPMLAVYFGGRQAALSIIGRTTMRSPDSRIARRCRRRSRRRSPPPNAMTDRWR